MSLFSSIPPSLGLSSKTTIVILSLLPVAIPTAYILILKATVSRRVTVQTETSRPTKDGTTRRLPAAALPVSLPADVTSPTSTGTICCERAVSRPVPYSALAHPPDSPALLTAYARAVMEAFSWLPQAFLIRATIKEPDLKASFETPFIRSLALEQGDVVNGVWRVTHRGGGPATAKGQQQQQQRIEYTMSLPASYTGPVMHCQVICILEPAGGGDDEAMLFVNETWIWRSPVEKPTMLEGAVGRWLHSMVVGWMMLKGIKAVTRRKNV
jgi:hypothetical protein